MTARPVGAAFACALALLVAAGCATKKPEPPKIPTESEYRERFTPERTRSALEKIPDLTLRETIDKYIAERGRAARTRGLRLAVDKVMIGERMGIGGGMELVRAFALYHEFDDRTFTTYLEGMELLGGRVRAAFRQPVGGAGKDLVDLAIVDLNRAFLDVYTRKEQDPPCCPSERGNVGYSLTGFNLEPLK